MLNTIKRKIIFWQYPKASNSELILDRRRIYILPNKAGFVFALVLFSIFITSINYGINLGYALNFILLSCGWLGIIFTYKNLAGLGLEALASPAVFSGELAHFSIHLNNRSKHARYAVSIGFDKTSMQLIDIPEHGSHSLTLAAKSQRHGWMSTPRIRIQTSFPFGLLTTWSYWQTTQQVLVYPAPELNPPPLPFAAEGASGSNLNAGNEEFSGVRNYQTGDSLKQLAWRQMARQSGGSNEQLISKHFEGGQQQVCMLDFSTLPPQLDVEQKLSRLCAWLLLAEQESVSYIFKLGTLQFPQNSGEDHQRACLTALALFNTDTNTENDRE
jgi:uncharacterized protein (DUF58 family)